MKNKQAILLPKTLPQELHTLLNGYICIFENENFLLCSSFDNKGYFFEASIIKNETGNKEWVVRLPIHYVLAVVNMSDSENNLIGILK